MKHVVSVFACAGFFAVANAQVSLQTASGALESAYAEWASDGSDSYNVYYSGAGASDVKVDAPLIRKYGSKYRVDVVGLKAGSYTLKVKNTDNSLVASGYTFNVVAYSVNEGGNDPGDVN